MMRHGPAALARRDHLQGLFGAPDALAATQASPVVQRVLHPETRRVREEEKVDWQTLLKKNRFSARDVEKISARTANVDYLTLRFNSLKDNDSEIDNLGGLKPHQKQNKKNKYKDAIENDYGKILSFAEVKLDEANDAYELALNAAVNTVLAFKARADRKWESGKPLGAGKPLIKHEKETVLPPLIGAHYSAAIGWVTAEDFQKQVMVGLSVASSAPPALSTADQLRVTNERAAVNAQLVAWATVAHDAPGVNENGTWGTSAGGAAGAFHINAAVSLAAWNALRKWWIRKAHAYVTPSDTSTWSLKMDRDPAVVGLSDRFNYHINVA
jgi:hypothetical protein